MTGLGQGLAGGLARWRAGRAVHDPGKILTDLVVALALGGDCLAGIAVLRSQPELAGPVASDPVVSRLINVLAGDLPRALRAIRAARAAARERAWALAGPRAPGADGSLIPVDIDATIVTAHSEKEKATPTWKKTFEFHPLAAFADHGTGAGGGSRWRWAILLRAGNAGSNTVSEHIEVTRLALAQMPRKLRRRVLVRTDSGGGTHEFLTWLASPGRHLHYSVGMTITEDMQQAILAVPGRIWEAAYDAGGQARPGAWVAEITGLLDLGGWPDGIRVIVRRERPTPAPSCASPTSAGTASPRLPPTRGAGSSRTSNYLTEGVPGARTGSAPPKTPGCVTSRCAASARTRCGANWWPWPANC